jgi:hypothetical protein
MRSILEAKMICSNRNKSIAYRGRLLVAGTLLFFASARGTAIAQQAPDANPALQSREPAVLPAPGWRRFEIRPETADEREAFLLRRQAAQSARPPREVPPLAAQAISPPAALPAQAIPPSPAQRP